MKIDNFAERLASYYANQFQTAFSKENHLPKDYTDEAYQQYIKAVAKLIANDQLEIHLEIPISKTSDYYLSPEIRHLIYMEKILLEVADNGKEFNASQASSSPYGIRGECHAMAAFHWVFHQDHAICAGISDKIHAHSWLLSPDNFIIEPTPIPRETYYGIIIKDPVAYVREELDRIKSMFDDPYFSLIHPYKERFLDEYYSL